MLALGVCLRPARALAACVPRQHVCRVKIMFPMVLEPKYLEKCIVQLKAHFMSRFEQEIYMFCTHRRKSSQINSI